MIQTFVLNAHQWIHLYEKPNLKDIESGFTDKLMKKEEENKKLQSSNHEKDKIISRLKAKVAEMEDNSSKRKSTRLSY